MHSPISLTLPVLGFISPGSDLPRQMALVRLLTAHVFGIPVETLDAPTRGQPTIALARQSAMYICHVNLELSFSEIGPLFGRDRTTVAHAMKVIEDRRDDDRFDELIGRIEAAVSAMGLDRRPPIFCRDGYVSSSC